MKRLRSNSGRRPRSRRIESFSEGAIAGDIRYFSYGTLQMGFPNYAAYADVLGQPLGRYRTIEPYPLVVPLRPACLNPGCRFVHRMCALLPDAGVGMPVEGELFVVDAAALHRLDRLESYRPHHEAVSAYVRRTISVVSVDAPAEPVTAQVYFAAAAQEWRLMLERGDAEVLPRYSRDLAVGPLKECCLREPDHDGPHDVVGLVRLKSNSGFLRSPLMPVPWWARRRAAE
jgi:gamma-glutamylcyclotransferase (GGCT)/AIG2-like uncharacterized protein YtfP